MRIERGIVPVERRAIRTDDFGVVAHVEKDMRVIERGQGAHAHELPGADFDHRNARLIVKMGNDGVRHGRIPIRAAGGDSPGAGFPAPDFSGRFAQVL